MDPNRNVFNGINGSTGRYVQPVRSAKQVADIAKGRPIETDERHLSILKRWWTRLTETFFAPLEGIDPRDLAQAGWGVVFPFADGEEAKKQQAAIREALKPLLDLRRAQAGRVKERYFREFVGPEAFRPNDVKQLFLGRFKATPGSPADPEKVPYYLLIVGDPETIPYRFQYQLDVEYAVGRIHFDTPGEYAQYAQSVVEAESLGRPLSAPRVVLRRPQ